MYLCISSHKKIKPKYICSFIYCIKPHVHMLRNGYLCACVSLCVQGTPLVKCVCQGGIHTHTHFLGARMSGALIFCLLEIPFEVLFMSLS